MDFMKNKELADYDKKRKSRDVPGKIQERRRKKQRELCKNRAYLCKKQKSIRKKHNERGEKSEEEYKLHKNKIDTFQNVGYDGFIK